MKLSIETSSYNSNRYGKPWIAVVSFKGDFSFGKWVGQDGTKGILEVEVNTGDVIAIGQRDLRKPRNSAPAFFIVGADAGTVSEEDMSWRNDMPGLRAVSKADAYRHYQAMEAAATKRPTGYELLCEKDRLLARIAEIDAELKAMLPDDDQTDDCSPAA